MKTSNATIKPILPKFVKLDEILATAVGMYLDDGMNSRNSEYVIQYTTKDTDIAKFMFDFFVKKFNIHH